MEKKIETFPATKTFHSVGRTELEFISSNVNVRLFGGKLSLEEKRLSVGVQSKNCYRAIYDVCSLHYGGRQFVKQRAGNLFFKVMNCIEPAY